MLSLYENPWIVEAYDELKQTIPNPLYNAKRKFQKLINKLWNYNAPKTEKITEQIKPDPNYRADEGLMRFARQLGNNHTIKFKWLKIKYYSSGISFEDSSIYFEWATINNVEWTLRIKIFDSEELYELINSHTYVSEHCRLILRLKKQVLECY